jgi:hypothetical protein
MNISWASVYNIYCIYIVTLSMNIMWNVVETFWTYIKGHNDNELITEVES